jgi:hypothetical protein
VHTCWFSQWIINVNRVGYEDQDAEIGKTLRESLECYVCREKLIAPVFTCNQSHYICGLCYPNLQGSRAQSCYCSQPINRFPGLDRIVEYVHKEIECKYAAAGCTHKENARTIMNHIRTCRYRLGQCRVW